MIPAEERNAYRLEDGLLFLEAARTPTGKIEKMGAPFQCSFCGCGVDEDALRGKGSWICRTCAVSASLYYWTHHDCMVAGAIFDKKRAIAAARSDASNALDNLEEYWWKNAPWRNDSETYTRT